MTTPPTACAMTSPTPVLLTISARCAVSQSALKLKLSLHSWLRERAVLKAPAPLVPRPQLIGPASSVLTSACFSDREARTVLVVGAGEGSPLICTLPSPTTASVVAPSAITMPHPTDEIPTGSGFSAKNPDM